MDFSRKNAIVIGGAGAIGGDVCKLLAEKGAHVCVCDINEQGNDVIVNAIKEKGGSAKAYKMNVRDVRDVEAVVTEIMNDIKTVDYYVYMAGGSARKEITPFCKAKIETLDKVLEINLMGCVYATRFIAPYMLERGTGSIVFTSSCVGLNGGATTADYGASKGGVMSFTKSLAKEFGPMGVRVNAVCPGKVIRYEEFSRPDIDKYLEYFKQTNYLGDVCMPMDIAKSVAFLLSDDARFITGENLVVDGARHLAMKGDPKF